jgi:hypothetical protein
MKNQNDDAFKTALARGFKGFKRREFSPDAPAKRTQALIKLETPDSIKSALEAWDKRIHGMPIVDIAYQMNLSIEAARALIKEAHQAIAEDLKDALEVNRALDLARIDGLIASYYPAARQGDEHAATVVLKCLGHRAKLTGTEPREPNERSVHPQNVLVWIQNQMPSINALVDSLPVE